MKIAVVGTGAAGMGILSALLAKQGDFKITVFDIGEEIFPKNKIDDSNKNEIVKYYNQVYKDIREKNNFKFPPPKTHFADPIPRQSVGDNLSIFKSQAFGGLTNYWGATMLPMTDREMKNWPINKEDLYPYYKKISKIVGLASEKNELDQYFNKSFSTRPAVKPISLLEKLNQVVNKNNKQKGYSFFSGPNRCGVETRKDNKRNCVYCGQCLAGCLKDSIYSTRMTIKKYLKDPRVNYLKEKVVKIDKNNTSSLETENGKVYSDFDKIFLSAGCPHTTEIVMRSIDYQKSLSMADNAVYVFPVIYLKRALKSKEYFSLCNLITCCVPDNSDNPMVQLQIYPSFEYMWRYNIPPVIWPLLKPFVDYSRRRVAFVRMYDHSDYSQAFSLKIENNELIMKREKEASKGERINNLIKAIRKSFNHNGFYVPPIKPILQKVNSHYTSTLPYNGDKIRVSSIGEVMKNVFVCDSSVFPDSPAVNPGFTIMANAYRTADNVLKDL